jgi:hypothetical protein
MGKAKQKKSYTFTCGGCGILVSAHQFGSRERKYCSRECGRKHMRGANNALWRGNRRHERGPTWKDASREARKRDGQCVAPFCGKTEAELGQKLSVDHIVPFRLTVIYGKKEGIDPNHLDNLACLCRAHHASKTQAERRLLKGDVIGFKSAVRTIIPDDLISKAFGLWGI